MSKAHSLSSTAELREYSSRLTSVAQMFMTSRISGRWTMPDSKTRNFVRSANPLGNLERDFTIYLDPYSIGRLNQFIDTTLLWHYNNICV